MTNPKPAELPVRLFKDAAAWEAWLARQHAKSAGLWLRIAKAASNVKSVSYAEALDVALCYGWIDGQKKTLDDATWLQKFTPRGKRSIWSKINRTERVRSGYWWSNSPPSPARPCRWLVVCTGRRWAPATWSLALVYSRRSSSRAFLPFPHWCCERLSDAVLAPPCRYSRH